jgi:integrase
MKTASKNHISTSSLNLNYESLLELLVSLGKQAETVLKQHESEKNLEWQSLLPTFLLSTNTPIPATSLVDYKRWLHCLAQWSKANHIPTPGHFTTTIADKAMTDMFGNKVSALRICQFYRRVWRELGMDESIWHPSCHHDMRNKEYYRRLTHTEILKLLNYLEMYNQDYHDMVVISYYTGLRLSDVAELEISEISDDKTFLVIMPNKVRTRRKRKLIIPLVREAKKIVDFRVKHLEFAPYLFSTDSRKRPSRKISVAFRRCGIDKIESGRASFHSLRSTFISLMDDAGVLPYITDAITGHSAGNMHSRYSQPSKQAIKKAILLAIPALNRILRPSHG